MRTLLQRPCQLFSASASRCFPAESEQWAEWPTHFGLGFETRVSHAQKRRLANAQRMIQDRMRIDVRVVLALVDEDDKIVLFNLGEADLESRR